MMTDLQGFSGRVNDNDLKLLRIFANIVRANGFAAAESRLQISLPSISRSIKDLEVRVGARLCERGKRGFSLTPEGRQVYDASLRLFGDLENFEDILRGIHQNPAGIVRVGLCSSLAEPRLILPGIIARYHDLYPKTRISISAHKSDLIEKEIADGALDVGIVFVRRSIDQIAYHHLWLETNYLYCAAGHPLGTDAPLRPDDLAGMEYAGYDFAHSIKKMGIDGLLERTVTADSVDTIAMLVQSGSYLGFLPEHYVDLYFRDGPMKKILPEQFRVEVRISAIVRQGTTSRTIDSFVEHLLSSATR